MTEKFTQWFPATTKPVHEGYYDTRTRTGEMVLYWNGKEWRATAFSPKARLSSFAINREWRGLATSPVVAA